MSGITPPALNPSGGGFVEIQETVPTDTTKNNPSTVLSFNAAGQMIYIDSIIGGNTYRETLSGSGSEIITDYAVSSTKVFSASVKL